MSNQSRIFTSFLQQILKTKTQQSLYYSTKTIIQSSVGIIFKYSLSSDKYTNTVNHINLNTSNKNNSNTNTSNTNNSNIINSNINSNTNTNTNIEFNNINIERLIQNWKQIDAVSVLMAQRAGYQKDVNALFPGGQADACQSDLQACKRQLKQQISLQVDSTCTYVGKIPLNFYYSKKKNKQVYISCNIWLLNAQNTYQPVLNKSQLSDYRWVPLQQLIDKTNTGLFDARQFGFFRRFGWKLLSQNIQRNLQTVNFPSLNVGMKRQLWGLTLWLVSFMLQMSAKNIQSKIHKQQYINDRKLVQQIQEIVQKLKSLDITFSRSYMLGKPMILAARTWHYFYRVRQFAQLDAYINNYMHNCTDIFIIISVMTGGPRSMQLSINNTYNSQIQKELMAGSSVFIIIDKYLKKFAIT